MQEKACLRRRGGATSKAYCHCALPFVPQGKAQWRSPRAAPANTAGDCPHTGTRFVKLWRPCRNSNVNEILSQCAYSPQVFRKPLSVHSIHISKPQRLLDPRSKTETDFSLLTIGKTTPVLITLNLSPIPSPPCHPKVAGASFRRHPLPGAEYAPLCLAHQRFPSKNMMTFIYSRIAPLRGHLFFRPLSIKIFYHFLFIDL